MTRRSGAAETRGNRVLPNSEHYRGRLAPTPTGYLHVGHAKTFATAFERACTAGGELVLRIEDLDPARCKPEFTQAAMEDLSWLGLRWSDGPVFQSDRRSFYLQAWRSLKDAGHLYPCRRSRRDLAVFAPHEEDPIFPIAWRGSPEEAADWSEPTGVTWRFRVPDGEVVSFVDGSLGEVARTGQKDFGDFVVWNRDDLPAYELAVVVDDLAMGITEVVRGRDLLTSTARQILLYEALGGHAPPAFFHTPLVCDASGRRLAKRDDALTLRVLRERGWTPERVLAWQER